MNEGDDFMGSAVGVFLNGDEDKSKGCEGEVEVYTFLVLLIEWSVTQTPFNAYCVLLSKPSSPSFYTVRSIPSAGNRPELGIYHQYDPSRVFWRVKKEAFG